ncbi:mechanosensitive ion channel family protein [Prosthecomicrobium sp. N25]|uniref:mechanosensitive ion channel family protein n=1 Tax=Prosthecomicrobium sp. N25 TaxID=3129254 RepID=UPI003077A3A1
MNVAEAIQPALDKIEAMIRGFFWVLPNLAIAAVVLAAFWGASWVARRSVAGVLHRRGREDFGLLLGGFARWGMILFGVLVAATVVFPSISPANLLSTLGIGSVALGFAFKDILQNWLSGLLILYRQPFRAGDQIRSGEFEGTVEHIEARATLIRTYDGQRVVIPNADIYTRAVTVRTAFETRRSEIEVGIGYGDDVERARQVILDAIGRVDGVEPKPAPDAIPWELSGSTVNLRVRWWSRSKRSDVVASRGRVLAAVKAALTEAGIDLPFPTRTVLLHDQTEPADRDRRRHREGWPPAAGSPPEPGPEAHRADDRVTASAARR